MKPRALLFDIYKTLLEVAPAPADAPARWRELCAAHRCDDASDLDAFARATREVIDREHAAARIAGVAHPEIYWPCVAVAAMPALGALDGAALDDFLFHHAQLQRTVRLMPGAAEALRGFQCGGFIFGIASNSQPYTLRELDAALGGHGLERGMFCGDLTFLSFEAGFSKPDPHVFRWLRARLAARGIRAEEAMMIGDRLDNDIEPSRAQGFQTWHLTPASGDGEATGTWGQLAARLGG